jgi:hypothetical protein
MPEYFSLPSKTSSDSVMMAKGTGRQVNGHPRQIKNYREFMATEKGIISNRATILARNRSNRLGMPCPCHNTFVPYILSLSNTPAIYHYRQICMKTQMLEPMRHRYRLKALTEQFSCSFFFLGFEWKGFF